MISFHTISVKLVLSFAGGGPCLQFVKNITSVKCNKVRHNKMRYACIHDMSKELGKGGIKKVE